jgi:hypothetical protein
MNKTLEWLEDKYDDVFYGLKLHKIGDGLREIKWFWQRGTRGYADCDTWNIDWTLAILIPKMLRHLAKNNNGCPSEMFDKTNKDNQCHLWSKKLEEIACGFDDFVKAEELGIETTYEDFKIEYDRLMANFHKQMDEFKKYYGHFWD